jgi:hypothetical protein
MKYRFRNFDLDSERFDLRRNREAIERVDKAPVIAVLPLSKIDSMAQHSGSPETQPADITTALSQLE